MASIKRKRGRPRKNHSHNLAEEKVNLSNEKVPYSDNLPEFFKIYMPALNSAVLRIPPDFIDKFDGNIPTTCKLKRPLGGSWEVDINRMDEHWFIQKGWPEFVEQNSLRDGDFLIFCFIGRSTFLVKVFSKNGCPKGSNILDEASESEDSEIEESKRRKKSRWGSWVGYMNGNSSFSVEVTKSNLRAGTLSVPKEFWNGHIAKDKRSSRKATLRVKSDAWSVEIVTSPSRVRFNCAKFINDNSLHVGNSCTFQLIDSNNLSFKVAFCR